MNQEDIVELLTLVVVIGKACWCTVVDFVQYFCPRTPYPVNDKVVVITGASRGLGKQLALQFAHLGAKVVLWSSKQANVDEVANEILGCGGNAKAYECDVTDEDQVAKVGKKVLEDFGRVDILINNAGVMHTNHVLDTEPNTIRKMYNLNVFAHFWTIREFLPHMIKQGSGHIVAISSIAGYFSSHGLSAYCGSKNAVLSMMECVELDAKGSNIDFTTICPGPFLSDLIHHVHSRLRMFVPVMSPEEVARVTMQAIRTRQSQVLVPGILSLLRRFLIFLFSRRAVFMIVDFLDYQFKNVE